MMNNRANPPLTGIKIIEFAGLGPAPLAGRLLADFGAEVFLIKNSNSPMAKMLGGNDQQLNRGKYQFNVDLKDTNNHNFIWQLIEKCDGLIEGFRPNVMERLGFSPEKCSQINQKLVFGRMTGWGQDGPLAQTAGHDLNYVALTGLLTIPCANSSPPNSKPQLPPPAMLGDAYGAVGMAFAMLAAIFQAKMTGFGQIIDAAIVDLAQQYSAILHWINSSDMLGQNNQASPFYQSPFYDLYQCSDGLWISIAALEPKFYKLLLEKLQLDEIVDYQQQYQRESWETTKEILINKFFSKTQKEWCELLETSDVCFAPVLDFTTSKAHPHNQFRQNYQRGLVEEQIEASPAAKFSHSQLKIRKYNFANIEAKLNELGIFNCGKYISI